MNSYGNKLQMYAILREKFLKVKLWYRLLYVDSRHYMFALLSSLLRSELRLGLSTEYGWKLSLQHWFSWWFWGLDDADHWSVISRPSGQQMHDGCSCSAVFLARRVGGGWPKVLSFGKLRDQNAQLGQVVRHLAMETLVYYRAVFVKFQQGGLTL